MYILEFENKAITDKVFNSLPEVFRKIPLYFNDIKNNNFYRICEIDTNTYLPLHILTGNNNDNSLFFPITNYLIATADAVYTAKKLYNQATNKQNGKSNYFNEVSIEELNHLFGNIAAQYYYSHFNYYDLPHFPMYDGGVRT